MSMDSKVIFDFDKLDAAGSQEQGVWSFLTIYWLDYTYGEQVYQFNQNFRFDHKAISGLRLASALIVRGFNPYNLLEK